MQMKAFANNEGNHAQHIRDYCEYADATAEAAADDVRQEIPDAVQKAVEKAVRCITFVILLSCIHFKVHPTESQPFINVLFLCFPCTAPQDVL